MKSAIAFVAASVALAAAAALAADEQPAAEKPAEKPVDFAVVASNAWLKCTTGKPAVDYAAEEDMKFTFSFLGVTNDIPKGKYLWRWTRRAEGADETTGTHPLEKKPFEYTTKLESPGFVRVDVQIVTADGKPFEKVSGKTKSPLFLRCGAGAGIEALEPPAVPKDYARQLKELKKQLTKVSPTQYKKIAREDATPAGVKAYKIYSVTVPALPDNPVSGYLTIPEGAVSDGMKYPCRLEMAACAAGAKQALPDARNVPTDEIVFVMAYDPGKPDARDEAFLTSLYLRVVRSLQFLKSLPEWNGITLSARGWGMSGMMAIWAAGCDEGVTKIECGLVERCRSEMLDPALVAGQIPDSCMVDIKRASLGDDARKPADAAVLWNALKCDRRITWVQASDGWNIPRGYPGRDIVKETIRPVGYRNMDAKHVMDIRGKPGPHFTDPEFSLRDKIVVEAIVDYSKPRTVKPEEIGTFRTYSLRAEKPVEVYAVIPERKPKDKLWEKFLTEHLGEKGGGFPFPFYLDAGMALPPPDALPWFHVADVDGIVRYSGPSQDSALSVARNLVADLPAGDPVFAYAKPDLLKDDIAKLVKSKLAGSRLYKGVESLAKRYSRTDKARAEEAKHLMLGMRQANEMRIIAIQTLFGQRASLAYNRLNEFAKAWPEIETHPTVKSLRTSVSSNPDIVKLAKIESDLRRLNAWHPTKNMDIKKKESEMSALRAKVARFAASKNIQTQGEAMLLQADIDNPPQEEDPSRDSGQGE